MVRSEERTRTDEDNRTTFYTTNILPQYHALNAGPWLRLEEYVEQLCKQYNRELFIVAGPIYHDTCRTVIGRGVRVPAECFKIIVVLPKGRANESVTATTPVIAVRMPNRPDISGSWEQYVTTVSDIERATSYRFFTALPDDIARALKQQRTGIISF
jgi:endonuclease G